MSRLRKHFKRSSLLLILSHTVAPIASLVENTHAKSCLIVPNRANTQASYVYRLHSTVSSDISENKASNTIMSLLSNARHLTLQFSYAGYFSFTFLRFHRTKSYCTACGDVWDRAVGNTKMEWRTTTFWRQQQQPYRQTHRYAHNVIFASTEKENWAIEYSWQNNCDVLLFIARGETSDFWIGEWTLLNQTGETVDMAEKQTKGITDREHRYETWSGQRFTWMWLKQWFMHSRMITALTKVVGQFKLEQNTSCGNMVQANTHEFEAITVQRQLK